MNFRRPSHLALVVLSLFLCFGGIAVAQEELTLESLRDRLVEFEARLVKLEALFTDPWLPDVIYTDDGICHNPLHSSHRYASRIQGHLHQETADAFRSTYGVSIDPSDAELSSISFGVDSSHVYLEFSISGQIVVEKWAHCEFLGHSEWSTDD